MAILRFNSNFEWWNYRNPWTQKCFYLYQHLDHTTHHWCFIIYIIFNQNKLCDIIIVIILIIIINCDLSSFLQISWILNLFSYNKGGGASYCTSILNWIICIFSFLILQTLNVGFWFFKISAFFVCFY